MGMESQLEQARDQYIWRQREALAKRKIKSCFAKGARFPSMASYRSRSKSWSACLGSSPAVPTSQTYISAAWRPNSESCECCRGLSSLHCNGQPHTRGETRINYTQYTRQDTVVLSLHTVSQNNKLGEFSVCRGS